MKRFFLAFFLLPATAFSQDLAPQQEPVRKHELGLNLFSMTGLFSWNSAWGANADLTLMPAPGVYYKYYCGKNVFRAALDYEYRVTHLVTAFGAQDAFSPGSGENKEVWQNGSVRIGCERELGSKKLVPFAAGDLGISFGNRALTLSGWGGGTTRFSDNVFECGISAGGGLKYKPGSRLTITLEMNAQAYFFESAYGTPRYSYGGGFRYNPVRTLGASWMF